MGVADFDAEGEHSFVVPPGITSLDVNAWPAGYIATRYSDGNHGHVSLHGSLAVTPGETLTVRVGGRPSGGAGGWNGGGGGQDLASGATYVTTAGCGASEILRSGDQLVVAGAPGGAGALVLGDPVTFIIGQVLGPNDSEVGPGGDGIVTTMPATTDSPRASLIYYPVPGTFPIASGPGTPGGTHDGADQPPEVIDPDWHTGDPSVLRRFIPGAGGGGYGGGGGGTITYASTFRFDTMEVDWYPNEFSGGSAGASWSESGDFVFAGFPNPSPAGPDDFGLVTGFVRFSWETPPGGWSVGHIRMS